MTRWYIPRVRSRCAGPADRHVRADRALVRLCLSRSRRCRLGLVVQSLVLGLGRAGASRTHIAVWRFACVWFTIGSYEARRGVHYGWLQRLGREIDAAYVTNNATDNQVD